MTINNQFWDVLGRTLIDSLWQGAIIMLLAFLGLVLLRKSSARIRHNLLLLCLLALPICSVYSFLQHTAIDSAFTVNNSITEEQAKMVDPNPLVPDLQLLSTPAQNEMVFFGLAFKTQWFGLIWAMGLTLMTLKILGGYFYLNRLNVSSVFLDDQSLKGLLDRLKSSLGINRPIVLRTSSRVSSPMIYGYFKPVILFPLGLIQGLTTEEVEVILLHELAHLKRNDFLINIVINVLRAVYFYHPAFWFLQSQLDNEREFATDELVISRQANSLLLIRALAKTQEFKMTTASLGFAGNSKHQLLKRVNRIMKKQQTPNWLSSVLVIAILASSSLLISQSAKQDSKEQQDRKETFDSLKAPFANTYLPMSDSLFNQQFQTLAPAYYRVIQNQDTLSPKTLKFAFQLPGEQSFDSLKAKQGSRSLSLAPISQDTSKVYMAILEIMRKDSPIEVKLGDDGKVREIRRNGKALKGKEFNAYKSAYDQLQQYAATATQQQRAQLLEEEATRLQHAVRRRQNEVQENKDRMESLRRQQAQLTEAEINQQQLERRLREAEDRYEQLKKMTKDQLAKKKSEEELEQLKIDLQKQLKEVENALKEEQQNKKRKKRKNNDSDSNHAFFFQSTAYSDDHKDYVFPESEYKEQYLDWILQGLQKTHKKPLVIINGEAKPNWDLNKMRASYGTSISALSLLSGEKMKKSYPKRKIKGRSAVIEVTTQ